MYFDNLGRFNYLPSSHPPVRYRKYTEEDIQNMVANFHFQKTECSKYWSMKLDVIGYMEVCTRMQMSFSEWIGMKDDPFIQKFGYPDEIKDALKREAEQVNERIRKEREDEISKLKLEKDSVAANRSFDSLGKTTAIDRVFN